MRLSSIHIQNFKRFADLTIKDLPGTVKLVLLTGPNGSGKTSVFEAFNYWISCLSDRFDPDGEYHSRTKATGWDVIWKSIRPTFHDKTMPVRMEDRHSENPDRIRKGFYIRTAYRHEPDFTSGGLERAGDILDTNRIQRLFQGDPKVSQNYQRIVANSIEDLYDPSQKKRSAEEITEKIIGQVRTSMLAVFDDLVLDGPGNPLFGGTFRFTKGTASNFHYKNLSGGEKAAFDLLLDFIIKREAFNDTIYCIDEAELHMHTRLQAKLLRELFNLVPDNCQLWLSTHSIGMARMATELHRSNPGEVAFLDFHDCNFDEPVVLHPIQPNRTFWKNMFATALDDISELIAPRYVVFCEGKKLGGKGRKPSFDVSVYKKIFEDTYPEVEFVPLGGTHEVEEYSDLLKRLLPKLAKGISSWSVFDLDDRSLDEVADLKAKGVHVLARRDLESYLWDDEVITNLCEKHQKPELAAKIMAEKTRLLQENAAQSKPADDIKAISGPLYVICKSQLSLTQCGNDAEGFAIATLAPLIKPGLSIYSDLEKIVLAPLSTPQLVNRQS